ncbi:MAG: extracellular solute-binding protein, partial [Anaerococcus sp.]|nr:extracellular solute-binding protein [Anaerococcus sp.]
MNLKKTFSKALLMAMSLVALTACGNNENNTTSDNKTETTQSTENKTEDKDKADNKDTAENKKDKPDTWIADREIKLLVFESAGDTGEGTMSPEIAQYIKDKTGITLTIESVSNEDSYEALAAGLSSGDLPDAVAFYLDNSGRPEFPLLLKASNEGMFADISKPLKESKIYGKYFEDGYLPADTKDNIMMRDDQDGATYLVHMSINRNPAEAGRKTIGGMYMRKDIAEDLGVKTDDIKTTEQMQELLEKIKKGNYKDKNGNPVTPLGPTSWGGSDRPWPYRDMVWEGEGAQKFLKDGDKVKHECMTDYAEKRVAKVRKWLADGLMDPEFYTMEETRAQEGIQNGSFAIVADSHNYRPEIANGEWIPLGDLNRADGSDNMIMPYKSGYTG